MFELILIPTALAYISVVGLLFVYGINFFHLTWLAWSRRAARTATPALSNWPRVTVQLPIYNELYVAQRLIRAAARLEYPAGLLEIQVLDDSTDETIDIVLRELERARHQGLNISCLHRAERAGFKAGALSDGLAQSESEFIAIFDADFIPPPDYLRKVMPHFGDARVAFIQTRWGHINRDYSFLTYLQSLAIDAHFMVEQFARSQAGYAFNFNGTAGVWRRVALEDAGGWKSDTLTEDLDLSYRAFLRGWRAVYLREVVAPAELPASFSAYRRQQHRWARGSFECALKLLPQVWRAPLTLAQKVEATLHLTGYGVHLLLCALVILYPMVIALSDRFPSLIMLFGLAFVFNVTAFAPTAFFIVAQQQLGRRWWLMLPVILFITALGAGMMLNTARAALQIAVSSQPTFERTPKFGLYRRGEGWIGLRYQLRLDRIVFVELAFALFNAGTVIAAMGTGNWVIGIYAALFCAGLLLTSLTTLAQSIAMRRSEATIYAASASIAHTE